MKVFRFASKRRRKTASVNQPTNTHTNASFVAKYVYPEAEEDRIREKTEKKTHQSFDEKIIRDFV